ncbi:MAG: hypothetical protein SFY69_04600 [Planctomycetota bacterium]|nr:hypothetical protein [Planctomycetota bacterium]
MPTSTDLLAAAEKAFNANKVNVKPHLESLDSIEEDYAAYRKYLSLLGNGKNSLTTSIASIKEDLAALNKGLADMNKNAAVFVSPADKKKYADLKMLYTSNIKTAMETSVRLETMKKQIESSI